MKKVLYFSLLLPTAMTYALTDYQTKMIKDAIKNDRHSVIEVFKKRNPGEAAAVDRLVASLGGRREAPRNEERRPSMPAHRGADTGKLMDAFNRAQSMDATELGTALTQEAFSLLLKANPERAKMVLSRLVDQVYPQAEAGASSKSNALGHLGAKQKQAKRKRK